MILIVTHREDYTADFLVNILNQRNIEYLRFNTDCIGLKHKISFTTKNDTKIAIDGISHFDSVWFRRVKVPTISFSSFEENDFYNKDYQSFFSNLWNTLSTNKWLSNPNNIYKAENKIFQLSVARKLGFPIPNTIISSDSVEIQQFSKENGKKIIIKPLYRSRFLADGEEKIVFTNSLKTNHVENESFVSFPMIFQNEIEKEYELRVTVVGKEIFAAKVDSQSDSDSKLDWRRKRLKFEPYNLPIDIQELALRLVSELGLGFGAIDLIKTKDGYVFLEINPNGQWVWIESDTGLKISDAIIQYLT
ncbi:RimK-like ATP-grasp domain-containing protein [Maribacter sedimenticola]|uniref:RimK-like ATP-grasp domain-containing protein n=1 Tax=Maribacter sedimenticola TaxID=228956 RepID=A0ABY1SH30_9FLAO|nr:hypothetical protein [Maribacter sedimenticola]SNR45466.1 RimK-like ATP-grasp domain-containing protein [Maribacter sedimenticola]